MGKLGRRWFQVADLDGASDGWKKILDRDPWHGDVYRQLVVCFARRGQRGLTLQWYDVCARVLQIQRRLEPAPETVASYHRVRRGEDIGQPL